WEREHLWLYLRAMGFDPKAAKRTLEDDNVKLGVMMFDVPNSPAFLAIALFLFSKLDGPRAERILRNCLHAKQITADPEFRKLCSLWMKEIASAKENDLPRVAASLFLSPTGPKFIDLMYRFARYVLIRNLRKYSAGTGKPIIKAVDLSPKNIREASARCRVACNEFLQILQKKDFISRNYRKKSQYLIKEIKQIKSECGHLQQQLRKMKHNDQNKNDKAERIQKVRGMWTFIMETLTSLKTEMEIVDSVLKSPVDQYSLDGTDVVVSVPRLLADKVESEAREVCTGNLYEDEKLNFLTVIQLLNEALRILRDEHCRFESKKQFQPIMDMIELKNKIEFCLKSMRRKIEDQHCILSESITRRQEKWTTKWKISSGQRLCLINQALDPSLVQAMLPPSLHPAKDDNKDDVSCQHLLSVSGIFDSGYEISHKEDDTTNYSALTPRRWNSSVPPELLEPSDNRDLLTEKELHIETYNGNEKPVPPKTSEDGTDELTTLELWENTDDRVTQTESLVKKEDLLKKARDELAEEVARTVSSESPQSGGGKGMILEDLISSLTFNLFLTRKQIPRTPENLLTEVRSSWRKAIQTENLSDVEPAPAEETTEAAASVDTGPTVKNKADTNLFWTTSSSIVSDFDSLMSAKKFQGNSVEFTAQKQISHVTESPVWKTSGMLKKESSKEQKLEDTVLRASAVGNTEELPSLYAEKSINTPNFVSEINSEVNTLPSDHLLDLVARDLQWDAPPVLSSDSCEGAAFGILHETLPDELDGISPNESTSLESDFDFLDSLCLPADTINKGDIQKSKLDLELLLSRCEMLKKSTSEKGEELHQVAIGDKYLSCLPGVSLTPKGGERDDLSATGEYFSLDEEFTKTPQAISLPEGSLSLSPLLVISQDLEEAASNIHKIPLDFIHKLKGK
ncbi:HAUS6 protein, partial [Penelope pileata]|nr:HAUS6 protein [Penelope pileata]